MTQVDPIPEDADQRYFLKHLCTYSLYHELYISVVHFVRSLNSQSLNLNNFGEQIKMFSVTSNGKKILILTDTNI